MIKLTRIEWENVESCLLFERKSSQKTKDPKTEACLITNQVVKPSKKKVSLLYHIPESKQEKNPVKKNYPRKKSIIPRTNSF